MASTLSLDTLNAASRADFTRLLDGTYEHSPWIAERAWDARPFATLAALKQALVAAVRSSNDLKEGVAAYKEKRKPNFTGT